MDYPINKGVNRPMEFKGIRAQYIIYMVLGLVGLLLLFAVLYLTGLSLYLILPIVGILGTGLFSFVSKYSRKYGEYGVLKQAGFRRLPRALKTRPASVLISHQQC